MSYEPTERDLQWARWLIAHLKDEGEWGWPGIAGVYRIDHVTRELELTNPEILADPHAKQMHERCRAVFTEVDYMVTP